jgi:nucleoside-diphosphate-sugar epimerase
MRIFLTGATGFIGSHIIPELISAGHQVVGLTRSEAGAKSLVAAGVEPYFGTLEAPEGLAAAAAGADAVIHTAFDHDFSTFMANCEKDKRVIRALGGALAHTGKTLVITSGTGIGSAAPGTLATEDVVNLANPNPRVASEVAGLEMAEAGVKVVVMRLPQVHDTRRQGLVSPLIEITREKGVCAYIGEGTNRWPAAHVVDVALLYRLAVEQGQAGERFHAVDEEGITAREIATVLGAGLGLPVVSLSPEDAMGHFGWFGLFAGLDMPASSAWTRQRLGWKPEGPGLLADLRRMDFTAAAAA